MQKVFIRSGGSMSNARLYPVGKMFDIYGGRGDSCLTAPFSNATPDPPSLNLKRHLSLQSVIVTKNIKQNLHPLRVAVSFCWNANHHPRRKAVRSLLLA